MSIEKVPCRKKQVYLKSNIRRGLQPVVINPEDISKLMKAMDRFEIKLHLFESLLN